LKYLIKEYCKARKNETNLKPVSWQWKFDICKQLFLSGGYLLLVFRDGVSSTNTNTSYLRITDFTLVNDNIVCGERKGIPYTYEYEPLNKVPILGGRKNSECRCQKVKCREIKKLRECVWERKLRVWSGFLHWLSHFEEAGRNYAQVFGQE